MQPEEWFESHRWRIQPEQSRRLSRRVRESGIRIGVVFPACDVATTLGKHLLALRHGWPGGSSPWAEISVVDLGSQDATVEIARSQDARLLEGYGRIVPGETPQEGLALVRAVEQLGCEIVLVLPPGLRRIDWDQVSGLVLALMDDPQASVAIGYENDPSAMSRLAMRPLLAALDERLSLVIDPTCPVLAVRSACVRGVPVACSFGYEPALLLELLNRHEIQTIWQVPVGRLFWSTEERRFAESSAFRAILALLETESRHGKITRSEEYGHIFSTISEAGADLQLKAAVQIFDWKSPG